MIKIVDGYSATIQDYPGRPGFAHLGIPSSGAMDYVALHAANMLVGNDPHEACLEYMLKGPSIEFEDDTLFSVCGAASDVKLNGELIDMWCTHQASKGDLLEFGFAESGNYGYIGIAGGIDVPLFMGSKSTYMTGHFGGFEGRNLRPGDEIKIGNDIKREMHAGARLREDLIPVYDEIYHIELAMGSQYDYLTDEDIEMMFSSEWTINKNSGRTGYRLDGPQFKFSEFAWNKPAKYGAFPSNICDTGYYLGGVNIAGQTPIIFLPDWPSAGGFIQPFIVPECVLWKVPQKRVGQKIMFTKIDRDDILELSKDHDQYDDPNNYI